MIHNFPFRYFLLVGIRGCYLFLVLVLCVVGPPPGPRQRRMDCARLLTVCRFLVCRALFLGDLLFRGLLFGARPFPHRAVPPLAGDGWCGAIVPPFVFLQITFSFLFKASFRGKGRCAGPVLGHGFVCPRLFLSGKANYNQAVLK